LLLTSPVERLHQGGTGTNSKSLQDYQRLRPVLIYLWGRRPRLWRALVTGASTKVTTKLARMQVQPTACDSAPKQSHTSMQVAALDCSPNIRTCLLQIWRISSAFNGNNYNTERNMNHHLTLMLRGYTVWLLRFLFCSRREAA
jgi:hypothetical protein